MWFGIHGIFDFGSFDELESSKMMLIWDWIGFNFKLNKNPKFYMLAELIMPFNVLEFWFFEH